jgi:hypothetical protein
MHSWFPAPIARKQILVTTLAIGGVFTKWSSIKVVSKIRIIQIATESFLKISTPHIIFVKHPTGIMSRDVASIFNSK